MGEHAFLPPSGSADWVACALWPTMNQRFPQADTEETREGNVAHWVLGEMLVHRSPNAVIPRDTPEGQCNEEMVRDAAEVCRFILSVIDHDPSVSIQVEKRVAIPSINAKNWGTPDVWFYFDFTLWVIDFKYGHRYVPHVRNWQLADYTRGILDKLELTPEQEEALRIVHVVAQPRCYSEDGTIRIHETNVRELRPMWQALKLAAEAALEPNPRATPGEGQCFYCPGRAHCGALQDAALSLAQFARASVTPFRMSPPQAGRELRALRSAIKILEARASGLEAEVTAACRNGDNSSGFLLQRTMGRVDWSVSPEAAAGLAALYEVNIEKGMQVLTPTQAIKAGVPEDVVKRFSTRKAGSEKLVPFEQSRVVNAFMQRGTKE